MDIAVVGGIFDREPEYVRTISTPETVLAEALRQRGHRIATHGHHQFFDPNDYDVVHVHHLGYGALRAIRRPRGRRAAVVYTRHRSVGTCPAGRRGRLTERLVLRRVDASVALFSAEARALDKHVRTVVTIPNGIDATALPYVVRTAPEQSEPWRFLYVGQLIPGKRLDLSLSLLTEWPNSVLLIASHHSPHRESVDAQARELGVEDRVRYLGRVPSTEMGTVHAQAHLLLLPSDDEALPSVVTEAMLSGLPVAATDVGGVRDQLAGAYDTAPAGDRSAFHALVRGLLSDYPSAVRRAAVLAGSARADYSIEQMARRHEELYEALVPSRTIQRLAPTGSITD